MHALCRVGAFQVQIRCWEPCRTARTWKNYRRNRKLRSRCRLQIRERTVSLSSMKDGVEVSMRKAGLFDSVSMERDRLRAAVESAFTFIWNRLDGPIRARAPVWLRAAGGRPVALAADWTS